MPHKKNMPHKKKTNPESEKLLLESVVQVVAIAEGRLQGRVTERVLPIKETRVSSDCELQLERLH